MAESVRENDLVLRPNEYAFVLDTTKGNVSVAVGPYKTSLSNSDKMVIYNEDDKKFDDVWSIEDAIHNFVVAPENFYVQLKNPTKDGKHPTESYANALPAEHLDIGRKVVIVGPCNFALFPGQMAKVISGHRMHSNQYLKARVYDAEAANASRIGISKEKLPKAENDTTGADVTETSTDETAPVAVKEKEYVVGQILIIKGTDVPFYIPPTGIEVLPIGGHGDKYVRDALSLRKLEYCILEDEGGKRSYIHGPAVVFPRPDQRFVPDENTDSIIYNAIELSEISGIYVKVISDYTDNDGTEHKIGEELFITGKDTPIYFPREEHYIIDYDHQVVNHAIAIPEGDGRYVMNRKTGVVRTVRGPAMFLPNPIEEVCLQRYLTKDQCELWYPGNMEVLKFNTRGSQYNRGYDDADFDGPVQRMCKSVGVPTGFSRKTNFTPPRTITLDSKFAGAVSISVRTGYAINVISKNGNREVVVGPKTILLDYDQTLEVLELSTGKPKTTDFLLREVYLRIENNKISDIIHVETSDFVKADVKVSYTVNFLKEHQDKWFSIENYVKFLCDRERSVLKAIVKQFTVEEFYANSSEIVRAALLGVYGEELEEDVSSVSMIFEENGMEIVDVDVLSVSLERDIAQFFDEAQEDIVRNAIELTTRKKGIATKRELVALHEEEMKIEQRTILANWQKKKAVDIAELQANMEIDKAGIEADAINQKRLLTESKGKKEITEARVEAQKTNDYYELELTRQRNAIRQLERRSQTNQITEVLDKISPQLVAAMQASSNAELLESITQNLSPYALAQDMNTVDVLDKIVRGTPLENSFRAMIETVRNK